MNKKKIGIVGFGYVGQAMCKFFEDHFDVIFYDTNYKKSSQEATLIDRRSKNKEDINKCDLAIVCVPTPMGMNGRVDTSIVTETVAWLETPLILIKSTVPPGTTEKLMKATGGFNIAFSPEYIGEGNYVIPWWKGYPDPKDMKHHDFQILGGDREITSRILPYFQRVLGPDAKYLQTDSTTAELVKYMENSWIYTKVMFCNEFYDLAKKLDVDYNELRELWLLDGRVERMHTAVFTEDRKVGGKCLPKDVSGIVHLGEDIGVDMSVLKAVLNKNNKLV